MHQQARKKIGFPHAKLLTRSLSGVLIATIVTISALALGGCGMSLSSSTDANADETDATEKTEEKTEELVPVEAAVVERGRIEAILRSSTNLECEAQVRVFARTANPVVELLVEEGDDVEKGQVVLRLESDTQRIQLGQSKARLTKAEDDHNRKKDLFEREFISQQDFNLAKFELKQAQLEVEENTNQIGYTDVRAPISGRITNRLINLGDQVNLNQHLFDIVDFDSMVARVYLPESNLAQLAVGQKARIYPQALAEKSFPGRIVRISPIVDAKTGTVKVTVGVDRVGALRPGMYVDVELVLAVHTNAILVPKRALVYDSDQTYVYRLGPENTVERLLIEPALMDKEFVEPRSAITAGERIIVAGQSGLKDGAKVRVLGEETPETTAKAEESPEQLENR